MNFFRIPRRRALQGLAALVSTGLLGSALAQAGKDAWPAAHWWYWFALRECSADTFEKAQSDTTIVRR